MAGACPTDDELRQAIAGTLQASRQDPIERHLEVCERCQQRCVAMPGIVPPDASQRAAHQRPAPSERLQHVIERLSAAAQLSPSRTVIDLSADWFRERLRFEHAEGAESLGRLAHYEVRRVIGRGGMGLVFEALDTVLNRSVAIKVLYPVATMQEESRRRFLREARAAAALQHEHIVAIHAVQLDAEVPYLVLEYVEGESLADRLRRTGPLPLDELLRIAQEIARGLQAAHAEGIVHRDIKPANILLERASDQVKIADFGLATIPSDATLTPEGVFAGTPEFTSPEQALGMAADPRSDLFSLGVVLYLAATGTSPFAADRPLLALDRVRQFHPPPIRDIKPSFPRWFSDVVEKLLAKDPRQRPQSASELIHLLEFTRSPVGRVRRISKSHVAAALAAGLLMIFSGLAYHWYRPLPNREPPASTAPPQKGFLVSGRQSGLGNLADAIAAADDGGIIDVHGDGPFPTPPLQIQGKRLTIRATRPFRPVFISDIPNQDRPAPFLSTDADLLLQGVTIYWRTDPPPLTKNESGMLTSSVIAATRGKLRLDLCRVIAAGGCNGVSASGSELAVTGCHLISDEGTSIYWRPSPGSRLNLENSALEGTTGLTLPTAADAPGAAPATLFLTHNTFLVDHSFQLIIQVGPKAQIHVDARHNIFDHAQMVHLYATRFPKNFLPDTPAERLSMLRSVLRWSDNSNVYRRSQMLSLTSVLAPRERP